MKVALVHDWLTGMRGGEKVLERLCLLFPDAPIYTLIWNRGSVSETIESHPIHTSFLKSMPGAARYYRWYLPTFPKAIESFDLGSVDAVISSSHAVAKGVRVPAGAFHLSYVHTPMRYVWDLEDQYFPPGRFPWPASWYVRSTCERLRRWDRATTARVDALVANSSHVALRIRRHYGREAEVVYPPVDVARFPLAKSPVARDYYLLAGALAPYKRADLALQACRLLGRRLLVVGSGQQEGALLRLAGPGVEFRGWVSDGEMADLYRGARALLYPGEEDFGIVPVEALASGCPVVAFGQGGALETVGRGAGAHALERVRRGGVAVAPGGVLFGAQTTETLVAAMGLLEATPFDPERLRALAEPFAPERFDREFERAFERGWARWRAGRVQPDAARRP
ncbi:MAG TPA: glycosyltransferase [Candidatus Limnocylindria bacterium]|nr:glycosyltransferase [Candidatus Limnocylindria bacterium]